MIYRNSVVSPKGFLYNVVLDEPAANATFLHANEGVIGIKNGAISYVYGPDTTANSNYSWLGSLGYGSVAASDLKTVTFSCTNGTVVATIGGVATTSPIKARVGTTIVFTITPDAGCEYTGENPETVVVHGDVTKAFVCEEIPYLKFTSTGVSSITMGVNSAENAEINDYGWDIEYSTDGGASWTEISWAGMTPISLADGESVKFRGSMTSEWAGSAGYVGFITTGSLAVSGDVTSLLNTVGGVTDLSIYPNSSLSSLFKNSTITSAANLILPSTTLTIMCYNGMFIGCTSLTSAPELPSVNLADFCYQAMFYGCTNLSGTINISAPSPIPLGASAPCMNMFTNAGTAAGAGGVINVGGSDAATWASNANIDTSHWTINVPPPGLKFTAQGTSTIKLDISWTSENHEEINETNDSGWDVQYSTDGGTTWINNPNWGSGSPITIEDGASIIYRGNMDSSAGTFVTSYTRFQMTGSFTAEGDVTYLLNNAGGVTDLSNYPTECLKNKFKNCASLTSVNLTLPSTTLFSDCYNSMFVNCSNLSGTINIAATSPYYEGTTSACTDMFLGAGTAAGAGGTINVGGSDSATWASNANIDTSKWTITVINAEEYIPKKEEPVDEPVKEEPVDEVIPEKVPDAEATE